MEEKTAIEFSVNQIRFSNTGQKEERITHFVQNRSKVSQKLRVSLRTVTDSAFALVSSKEEKTVAPGLKLPVTIQFSPAKPSVSYEGQLDIFANYDLLMTIPIFGHPPTSCLSVSPTNIDFGYVACGYQNVSHTITIVNTGNDQGTFSFLINNLPSYFTVYPFEGTVEAGAKKEIQITLHCRTVVTIKEQLNLKLDSNDYSITITADIVQPKLELLDESTLTPIDKLCLGEVYYGSMKHGAVKLYNNSPSPANYIVLFKEQPGIEQGVDMKGTLALACTPGGLYQNKWKEQGNSPDLENIFMVNPKEGTLAPYQTQQVEICFSPIFEKVQRGWKHHQGLATRRDYGLFVQFLPVGLNNNEEGGKELGLTATALPVNLSYQPEELDYGPCFQGVPYCKTLSIRNNSTCLNLMYRIKTPAQFKADDKGCLPPQSTQEVIVAFHPRQFGNHDGYLVIEVLGESYDGFKSIEKCKVVLKGTCIIESIVGNKSTTQVACLNDLPLSIKPHDRRIDVRSPYTKAKRHTYIDPDYTYTDEEMFAIKKHNQVYQDYLQKQRTLRLKKGTDKKLGAPAYMTSTDIGIQPAAGISPLYITLQSKPELKPSLSSEVKSNEVCLTEIQNPLNQPYGVKMLEQCNRKLSPKELSFVITEPSSLTFESTVKNNFVKEQLNLTNKNSKHVMISLKVKSDSIKFHPLSSLETISQWQFVLPPLSYITVPVVFHANVTGELHESIECTINSVHRYYIPVTASVVEISLSLSSTDIVLSQPHLSIMNYVLEGHVTLSNPHHVPANFSWHLGEHESYVMVTHMEGVVPAYSSLICTVFCQGDIPSTCTPICITLLVEDRESHQVTCSLKYGRSDCHFQVSRVFFNPAPQFLSMKKTIHIKNKSENHAYFEVADCHPPLNDLTILPVRGCVPAGGTAPITLELCASEEKIFDTWLKINSREGKTMSLRVAGSVETPRVYIDLDQFNFGSVYCGGTVCLPFTLHNMGQVHAEVSLDLTSYHDFSLILPNDDDPYKDMETALTSLSDGSGHYHLILPASVAVDCTLQFKPKDVASYDFILPILVNGKEPVPPPLSCWPPSNFEPQVATGGKLPSFKNTPRRRVLGTGIASPLDVENCNITFHIPPDMGTSYQISDKEVLLKNTSLDPLTWGFSNETNQRIADGTFKLLSSSSEISFTPPLCSESPSLGKIGFLRSGECFKFRIMFSPAHHGHFNASLLLYINGNTSRPYRVLQLSGTKSAGRLTTSPSHIAIQPVPLGVTVEAQFFLILERFFGRINLVGKVPSVLPDGVQMSVNLHVAQAVKDDEALHIPCVLSFSSSLPISMNDCITFTESNTGIMRKFPFSVTADNSLFSTYEFISENLGSICFQANTFSNVPSLHLPLSSHTTSLSSLHTGKDQIQSLSVTSSALEYGSLFLQQSKMALCRYISLFGWPDGMRQIKQPQDLMECVGKQAAIELKKRYSKALTSSRGPLLDFIRYICGRLPPGIPLNPPPCHTRKERVDRHYQELSIILAFLKAQGALLWSVVPESLMDWKDLRYWRETNPNVHSVLSLATEGEFQVISEKAWTYALAQILKVLVLPKLISKQSDIDQNDNISSNIYSSSELTLLNWLNYHFEKQGKNLFGDEFVCRRIQTFDVDLMDSIVLACVLISHVPSLITQLKDMYYEPSTPEQVSHNSQLLAQAIRSIGINYDIQASDISAPNPLMLVMFCSHLFHILPYYLPSSTINLQGPLHTTISKEVTVENNSNKVLKYRGLFIGDNNDYFNLEGQDNSITISSKGSKRFLVTFKAKHLGECNTTLLLLPRGGGGKQGYPISFKLIGEVTIIHPQSVIVKAFPLYQINTILVPLVNIFSEVAEFSVSLVEKEKIFEEKQRKTKKKEISSESFICSSSLKKRTFDTMKLFHTHFTTIALQPNQQMDIEVEYIPLKMFPRHCSIILHNEKLGDLVFVICTTVNLPLPSLSVSQSPNTVVDQYTKTIHMKTVLGDSIQEVININVNNESFESAVQRLGEWEMSPEERKRLLTTGSVGYVSLLGAVKALNLESKHKTHTDCLTDEDSCLHFDVSCDSEYLKVPETVSVQANNNSTYTQLPIEFNCDMEGNYPCCIVLSSLHDIRVYLVEVLVINKGRKAELEIRTPALDKLTQRIPLANPTSMDWPLKVHLTGNWFYGPSHITVQALTTGYYPLTFSPRREETVEGQLLLVNTHDHTEHCFKLTGIGERPLAQENISIHTQAKKRTTHILHVPNTSDRTTVYRVETDLDIISGPSTFTVSGNDVADCPVMIEPLVRGTYDGAIVFTAESRSGRIRVPDGSSMEHLWYQLNIVVDPADPVAQYHLSSHVFSYNTLDINVPNPLGESVTLQVAIEGSYLSGPSELQLDAESQAVYTLKYSPLMLQKERARVLFMGQCDGEMTVDIELEALDPNPIELDSPKCELGKSSYTTINIENPLDKEVVLTYCQTDSNFTVVGLVNGTLVLLPKSSSDVSVMFKPSQLGWNHETTLKFVSKEFGQQEFIVKGEGLPPSILTPTVISSALNQNSTAILSFTNPLSEPTNFNIKLESNSDHFCLFLKQTRSICLHPGVSLDIPVMFSPDCVEICDAQLSVTASNNEELLWIYPIIGQPEIILSSSSLLMTARAKERTQERLVILLQQNEVSAALRPITPGYYKSASDADNGDLLRNKYFFGFVFANNEDSDILQLSTGLRLIGERILDDQSIELVFDIVFLPPKPFSCKGELHIQPNGYGLWRQPVTFTATNPVPDDVLTLQAQHLTNEVKKGFRLTSLSSQPLSFKASLASSSPELTFYPTSGILPPSNEKGLLFTVTYQPRTFNEGCSATLLIETHAFCWCYEIIGKPLAISLPDNVPARVDHLHKTYAPPKPTTRNFIRHNMQQLAQTY